MNLTLSYRTRVIYLVTDVKIIKMSSHFTTLSSMNYCSIQSRLRIPCRHSSNTIQLLKNLEPFVNCQRQAKRLVLLF